MMKRLRILAAIVLAAVLMPAWAQADGPVIVGMHLGSRHSAPGFNDHNPGAYAVWGNGLTLGVVRNSESAASVYAGRTWYWGHVGLTVGGITGYRSMVVTPMVVPSVALQLGDRTRLRLAYLAKVHPAGAHALHFMLERTI